MDRLHPYAYLKDVLTRLPMQYSTMTKTQVVMQCTNSLSGPATSSGEPVAMATHSDGYSNHLTR